MNHPRALPRLDCRLRTGSIIRAVMLLCGAFLALGNPAAAHAEGAGGGVPGGSADSKAQTIVHMLDYVSVDYPEFVRDGTVLNPSEYAEQREFASQAVGMIEQLPAAPDKPALLDGARQLLARIDAKAAGDEVSRRASRVRAEVIRAYRLSVAPAQAPDLRRGAALFEQDCAACHGALGHGDGPLARAMEPVPRNFHDDARMRLRSLYGLYDTIELGVAGTPMRAFSELSEADRWALAFYVGGLRASAQSVARGESLWHQGRGNAEFASLRALATATAAEVSARGGAEHGAELDAVRAYLTAHPDALQAAAPPPLALTRTRLGDALDAYRQGDRERAGQLAISAYLEGFELVEASLDNVDAPLRAATEREMMALRAAIAAGKPADSVGEQVSGIDALLDRADDELSGADLSPGAAFASAVLILLREGLEAILVLAAIVAFVVKTKRRDALPYIHAGWIGALVLGAATWIAARYLLTISGANRELTEGATALVAAAMLLYVGYWLHSKSNAQAWQSFIRHQVTAALGKRTLWAMAGISFLAVYRELFEIILFYETLWQQVGPGGHDAVLGGIAVAAALLAVLGGAILKFSVRLPIGPFFSAASALLAIMAVVFVGNGVAALQEAGVVDSTAVSFVSLPLIGVHPTLQGLLMQGLALALVLAGAMAGRRQSIVHAHH